MSVWFVVLSTSTRSRLWGCTSLPATMYITPTMFTSLLTEISHVPNERSLKCNYRLPPLSKTLYQPALYNYHTCKHNTLSHHSDLITTSHAPNDYTKEQQHTHIMSRNYYANDTYAHQYPGASPPYNPGATTYAPYRPAQQTYSNQYQSRNEYRFGSAVWESYSDEEEEEDNELEERVQMSANFNDSNERPTD